jgi:hypothetical protein
MKKALLLLAMVAVTGSLHAVLPADLRQLASQIETFPLTKGKETESRRLAKFFEMYWAACLREAPNFATYIGYPGLGRRLPDLSEESVEFSRRLAHLELTALSRRGPGRRPASAGPAREENPDWVAKQSDHHERRR